MPSCKACSYSPYRSVHTIISTIILPVIWAHLMVRVKPEVYKAQVAPAQYLCGEKNKGGIYASIKRELLCSLAYVARHGWYPKNNGRCLLEPYPSLAPPRRELQVERQTNALYPSDAWLRTPDSYLSLAAIWALRGSK